MLLVNTLPYGKPGATSPRRTPYKCNLLIVKYLINLNQRRIATLHTVAPTTFRGCVYIDEATNTSFNGFHRKGTY